MATPNTPPPPPPLPQRSNKVLNIKEFENKEIPPGKCSWASKCYDLQWTCAIHSICDINNPIKCTYREFTPIKQEGPTCGLVALSILLNNKVTPKQLLEQAIFEGFSNNGEIFSTQYLFELLESNIEHGEFDKPNIEIYKGTINSEKIMTFLLNGGALLVPYDSWYNHAPCLAKGHKAHWALVCGVIIPSAGAPYVLAWHGKSKRLAVWHLHDLAKSNLNLHEMSPQRMDDALEYVIPYQGLSGPLGLKGQFILIEGFKEPPIFLP